MREIKKYPLVEEEYEQIAKRQYDLVVPIEEEAEQPEEAALDVYNAICDTKTITGQMHSFYERLFFPNMLYKEGYPTLVEHKIPTACIYTMNVDEKEMIEGGYRQNMELWENFLTWYYSKPLIAYAFNTYQFDDYSKYICEGGTKSTRENFA